MEWGGFGSPLPSDGAGVGFDLWELRFSGQEIRGCLLFLHELIVPGFFAAAHIFDDGFDFIQIAI